MLMRMLTPEQQERRDRRFARFRDLSPEENKARAERVMLAHDSLPEAWRLLVHEYGLAKVQRLYRGGKGNYKKAERELFASRIEIDL